MQAVFNAISEVCHKHGLYLSALWMTSATVLNCGTYTHGEKYK